MRRNRAPRVFGGCAMPRFTDPLLADDAPPEGLALERMLTLPEVTALTGLSPDTLRRRYPHLIRKMSPRRVAMKLRDVLAIGA
jgi:hypothetical protein